jgi:hydroxyacylglutathione hydrolase
MILERFVVGMLQTNCYLLGDTETRSGVVIDPGSETNRIAGRIGELDLQLAAILCTHGHFDHVMAAWSLKDLLGGEIFLHPKDELLLKDRMVGLGAVIPEGSPTFEARIDRPLQEGDSLTFGSIRLKVLETPGHSAGHVSFHFSEANAVFVGDTLFAGSIGRTDFPGGSYDQLIRSVREKIFPLDDGTMVYPGHGPETTVAQEKRTNPFFR